MHETLFRSAADSKFCVQRQKCLHFYKALCMHDILFINSDLCAQASSQLQSLAINGLINLYLHIKMLSAP